MRGGFALQEQADAEDAPARPDRDQRGSKRAHQAHHRLPQRDRLGGGQPQRHQHGGPQRDEGEGGGEGAARLLQHLPPDHHGQDHHHQHGQQVVLGVLELAAGGAHRAEDGPVEQDAHHREDQHRGQQPLAQQAPTGRIGRSSQTLPAT